MSLTRADSPYAHEWGRASPMAARCKHCKVIYNTASEIVRAGECPVLLRQSRPRWTSVVPTSSTPTGCVDLWRAWSGEVVHKVSLHGYNISTGGRGYSVSGLPESATNRQGHPRPDASRVGGQWCRIEIAEEGVPDGDG